MPNLKAQRNLGHLGRRKGAEFGVLGCFGWVWSRGRESLGARLVVQHALAFSSQGLKSAVGS